MNKQYYFTGNRQDLLDNGFEECDNSYFKEYGTDCVTINLDNRVIKYDNDMLDLYDQDLDDLQVELGDCDDLIEQGLVKIIEVKND
ncbi:MAG: hypothetical protein ACI4PF_03845 [Christensenellales bacterium]